MALAGVISAFTGTAALAQDAAGGGAQGPVAAPEAAPAKRVTVTTGLDFSSAYFFRGLKQQSGGAIAQPYFDVGVSAPHGISFNVGNWDSLHSKSSAGHWYESDYYAAVNFTAGKAKPGLLYTSYTSPADLFTTVHELAGVLAFDDSANAVPVSPKVTVAFELADGQADAGNNKGIYLEAGIKPAVKLAPKATLLIPIKAGFSLKDYYEGVSLAGTDENDAFGYFDTGLQLSVPAISGSGGALEFHGGFDILWLGRNLKALNSGDGVKPVAVIGFTYTY